MLVCSVSLLRRHAGIAADIAETAVALDSPGTGNVVFATLVDDPTSVLDHVDAYFGLIMLEVASATATVNAASTYATAIVEAVTAVSAQDAAVPTIVAAAMTEVAAAASAQDAVIPRVARSVMLPRAFVSSPGTVRQANVNGVMVNL